MISVNAYHTTILARDTIKSLNPIWHGGDTFIPLSLLDQILSADFFSKRFQIFLEVKIYINRVILTPWQAH